MWCARRKAYSKLRGCLVFVEAGCSELGTSGPNWRFYCRKHMSKSLAPGHLHRWKFASTTGAGDAGKNPNGSSQLPDPFILSLIETARRECFCDQYCLVAYRTAVYGGDFPRCALRVNEIESMGKGRGDPKRRAENIDVAQTVAAPWANPGTTCANLPNRRIKRRLLIRRRS